MEKLPVRNILVSVSDKRGLDTLIPALESFSDCLLASDGSYNALQHIAQNKKKLRKISDYTAHPPFAERVKTLDFKLLAGILAEDRREFKNRFGEDALSFDMVICNLYPFADFIRENSGRDIASVCAHIDIGGMTLLRAAAKNFLSVCVLSDPGQYDPIAREVQKTGGVSLQTRYRLCRECFASTAEYERCIAEYFADNPLNSFPKIQ